jgi:hypothetical protein
MDLPPIGAYRRGTRIQPLMNLPALDNSLLFFLASNTMSHGKRAAARRTIAEALLYTTPSRARRPCQSCARQSFSRRPP